jgi:hypothetical protein
MMDPRRRSKPVPPRVARLKANLLNVLQGMADTAKRKRDAEHAKRYVDFLREKRNTRNT